MACNPIQNGLFIHENTSAPEHPGLMAMFSLRGETGIITTPRQGNGNAPLSGE